MMCSSSLGFTKSLLCFDLLDLGLQNHYYGLLFQTSVHEIIIMVFSFRLRFTKSLLWFAHFQTSVYEFIIMVCLFLDFGLRNLYYGFLFQTLVYKIIIMVSSLRLRFTKLLLWFDLLDLRLRKHYYGLLFQTLVYEIIIMV